MASASSPASALQYIKRPVARKFIAIPIDYNKKLKLQSVSPSTLYDGLVTALCIAQMVSTMALATTSSPPTMLWRPCSNLAKSFDEKTIYADQRGKVRLQTNVFKYKP